MEDVSSGPGSIRRRGFLAGGVAAGVGTAAAVGAVLATRDAQHGSPSGGGASPTSLGFVDVRSTDFGAVGDGSADDTAAIAKAYEAAQSGHRPMYFPPGTYKVTSLPSMADRTTVFGAGAEVSTIVYGGNDTLLSLKAQRVAFKNIGFWLQGESGTLVSLSNCFRCSFDSVTFRGQYSASPDAQKYRGQVAISLSDNTGGTSFINCDINNFGTGMRTTCIQNYISNSKFATNHIGILGTGNNFNAGMGIVNTEFVSSAAICDAHILIDGAANDWWITNTWFEGSKVGVSVGTSGKGGPSQFGMVNCKVAASVTDIDLQHCRQPYLANVILDRDDPNLKPNLLVINPATVPDGVAINLIDGVEDDFPAVTFPPNWSVIGRRRSSLNGVIVTSPNGHNWSLQVSDQGVVSASDLGV